MIPRLPATDLDIRQAGSDIQDIREILQQQKQSFIHLYHQDDNHVQQKEFKTHDIAITMAFQAALVNADYYVWAIIYWLSGCRVISDMDTVVRERFPDALLLHESSHVAEGWPGSLRMYVFKCVCSYYKRVDDVSVASLVDFFDYTVCKQIHHQHDHIVCSHAEDHVITSLVTITTTKSSTATQTENQNYQNRNMRHFLHMYPTHTLECARSICAKIGGEIPSPDLAGFITSVHFRVYPTSNTVNIVATTVVQRNTYSDPAFPYIDMTPDIASRSNPEVIPPYVREAHLINHMNIELTPRLRRVVDWLRYHDTLPILRCISGTVSRRYSSTLRLSPFVKVISPSDKVCGGIVVFDECYARAICMLAMCEQQPTKGHQGAQTLIVTNQVSFWENSVHQMVRPSSNMCPMVYHVHGGDVGVRHRDTVRSRYVIVTPRALRTTPILTNLNWFRVIVDAGVKNYISNKQGKYIQSLTTQRRWCVGAKFSMNLCPAINLWSLIAKPTRGGSVHHETTAISQGITLIVPADHQSHQLHLCSMSERTRDTMFRFSMHLDRTRMYQRRKFVQPMMGLLAKETSRTENDLWDVFISEDSSLPPYSSLTEAPPSSGIMLDNHCIICFESMHRPVQLNCRHILCYECASMISKCPACRQDIGAICYLPVGNYNININIGIKPISDKVQKVQEFIDSLIMDNDHVKIVLIGMVTPVREVCMEVHPNDRPCAVDNALFHFINTPSSHIIRLPIEQLQHCHLTDGIDHIIVPFYSTMAICSCSTNVKVHHFLYQQSIEEYMYSNLTTLSTTSLTSRREWIKYINFINPDAT